jgi:hypothetical protein
MSIRERVERDKLLEAAERAKSTSTVSPRGRAGAAGRGAHKDDDEDDVVSCVASTAAPSSESSFAQSQATYNSLEPMERSEIAAAALVSGVAGSWECHTAPLLLAICSCSGVDVYPQQQLPCPADLCCHACTCLSALPRSPWQHGSRRMGPGQASWQHPAGQELCLKGLLPVRQRPQQPASQPRWAWAACSFGAGADWVWGEHTSPHICQACD